MIGALLACVIGSQDLLIADFEGATYGKWKVEGEAFGSGPARGTLEGQMTVSGFLGKGLVNSFYHGDATVGTLTSPPFRIERRYISFLIGGGMDRERTCMNLLVDGRVVRNSTGPNDRPGGSEALLPEYWDVKDLLGKSAVIQIVDRATGGWGHINVDQIVQTDRVPARVKILMDATRQIKLDKRYLLFPIKDGAPLRKVAFAVGGKEVVTNDIGLADSKPDWWAPMDVSAWKGKVGTITVDSLRSDSKGLESIRTSEEGVPEKGLYSEPLRAQFRFSPRRGWNNDPNGMVFFNGEYHLFFQHNPYGWGWGNMHWGHAVSTDMVHWQELGDALAPDALGTIFSGSAVVDQLNTSGLGKGDKPPLVLFYTAAGNGFTQCLAFSTDGRTFTKFSGNPVVPNRTDGNRDPKVFWHEPTRRWVMALYVERSGVHTIEFFTSPNLREWTYASRLDGFFECPDVFELPLDGDAGKKKWIVTAASSEYMVGSFDGVRFTPETPKLPGHRGRGFYAAQTFNNEPAGRRIQIGWFQTETKGMPFNQSMTVPLELQLVTTAQGPRLKWWPIRELESLRTRSHPFGPFTLREGDKNPLVQTSGELLEIRASFEPSPSSRVSFRLRGAAIVFDAAAEEVEVNGVRAPAPMTNGRQELAILVDRTGFEVFVSGGLTYLPMPYQPVAADRSLSLEVSGGVAKFDHLEVHELRSAWKK